MRGSQCLKPTLALFIRRTALREGIFQFGILGNVDPADESGDVLR